MSKKLIIKTAAAILCILSAASLSAHATTVDDVAEVARQYGYSEDIIMSGYNKYYEDPDKYTSEDFDKAINELHRAEGIMITTGPQVTASATESSTVTTTTVSENTTENNSSESNAAQDAPDINNPAENTKTVTTDNGEQVTRISEQEFIDLSYEQKMEYISSFTPEEQQAIIDNLTPEEYKSIMKQLPVEQKAEVAESLSKAGEAMGLNVTVDEITDDTISVSLRDEDGTLVGMANAGSGALVEDTGYDRRGIIFGASAVMLTALGLLGIAVHKCFGKKKIGDENE